MHRTEAAIQVLTVKECGKKWWLAQGRERIAPRAVDAYSDETYRIQEQTMSVSNPFFTASPLPYQAPPFDLIEQEHYRPAFDEGVRQKREQIAAIAQNSAPADFDLSLIHI